jgi:hypothetical protein
MGMHMIKRNLRGVVESALIIIALLFSGCANMEFYKNYKLSQPDNFWCASGTASPFPPYCQPDRW